MRLLALILLSACVAPTVDEPWGDDASAHGWAPNVTDELAPPVADLDIRSAAIAGAPLHIEVSGMAPGTDTTLLVSTRGTGVGPCHPVYGDICLDLLSPKVVGSATAGPDGVARYAIRLPRGASSFVYFQAAVLDPAEPGVSTVADVEITSFDVVWDYDVLEVSVDGGESGYDFGMAETGPGPLGWYGEDCYLGTPPYFVCHPLERTLILESVHPEVGGPGIDHVIEEETTLFYDIHEVALTYYVRGWDSDECFAWGQDPSYYEPLGCTTL